MDTNLLLFLSSLLLCHMHILRTTLGEAEHFLVLVVNTNGTALLLF